MPEARQEITWDNKVLFKFDPLINKCEPEVQRIIYLQSVANQLHDVFTDTKGVVKSYITAVNA